jgi:hypothetical protein
LWGARSGTTGGDRLETLATLIDAYQSEHYQIDPPDPIAAVNFRLEQKGFSREDPEESSAAARIAKVRNRRRGRRSTRSASARQSPHLGRDLGPAVYCGPKLVEVANLLR